jgi:hypothetical protein
VVSAGASVTENGATIIHSPYLEGTGEELYSSAGRRAIQTVSSPPAYGRMSNQP